MRQSSTNLCLVPPTLLDYDEGVVFQAASQIVSGVLHRTRTVLARVRPCTAAVAAAKHHQNTSAGEHVMLRNGYSRPFEGATIMRPSLIGTPVED